jgi:hypothetical protein
VGKAIATLIVVALLALTGVGVVYFGEALSHVLQGLRGFFAGMIP